jgi:hypothetical protein
VCRWRFGFRAPGHRCCSARLASLEAVDERARQLLQRHGWRPGATLGAGAEGTVVDLSAQEVAKVWHGRSGDDISQLLRFSAALHDAALPFDTPRVLDLLEDDRLLITIEHKLHGHPLWRDGEPAPPPISADEARIIGDVLEGFSRAAISDGLDALPILPGHRPFDPSVPFPESLADLVKHRFDGSRELLGREIGDIDDMVNGITGRLRGLTVERPAALLHGDLIPANVLIRGGRISAVLDFGFLTALGDPRFDAAVTASIFDMYGPNARATETTLDQEFQMRFGHDGGAYSLYRAAYAVITSTYYSSDGADGHFAWCVRMLRRPDVRAAVLSLS